MVLHFGIILLVAFLTTSTSILHAKCGGLVYIGYGFFVVYVTSPYKFDCCSGPRPGVEQRIAETDELNEQQLTEIEGREVEAAALIIESRANTFAGQQPPPTKVSSQDFVSGPTSSDPSRHCQTNSESILKDCFTNLSQSTNLKPTSGKQSDVSKIFFHDARNLSADTLRPVDSTEQ